MVSRNIVQTALTHVVRSVFASLFNKNILLLNYFRLIKIVWSNVGKCIGRTRFCTVFFLIFGFCILINPFSPSHLSSSNFSLHKTYKVRHLVMRKWELIKQSKLLKIKSKFSQTCSMKSKGSSWENLIIQLGLKGLTILCVLPQ